MIKLFIKRLNKPAIYYKDSVISYNELYDNVVRYSNALDLVANPGERIIIRMSDRPENIYLFWAAMKSAVIPVLLNRDLDDLDIEEIVSDCNPKKVFTDDNIKAFDESATNTWDGPAYDKDPAGEAFVLYTSGTTGFFKYTPHSMNDIVATCENYSREVLELNENDICLSAAKTFFAYGLGNVVTFPLYNNSATILLPEKTTVKNVFECMEKYKPTVYFGVPTLYAQQVLSLRRKSYNTSSLRLCVSAGEALPAPIYNEWKDATGVEILDGIGTTEALHIFISNRMNESQPECSGYLVKGYDARLIGEDGEEVGDGEEGYLQITGPSIFNEDWLDTGDMFIRKGDMFFYRGRKGDMFKANGQWVSPFEIESIIMEHPDVEEVAVIGCKDNNELTKPKAYIVTQNEDLTDIRHLCKDRLAKHKRPRWFKRASSLPKTSTGKIQRFKLRVESDIYDI